MYRVFLLSTLYMVQAPGDCPDLDRQYTTNVWWSETLCLSLRILLYTLKLKYMERKKEVFHAKNQSDLNSRSRQYHHITVESTVHMDGDDYYTCIGYHFTPDEVEENMIYGDPRHEAYLCSEEYEEDCKQEQWDWLKNERG